MGRRPGRAACGDGSSALIVVDTSAWVEYLRATGSPANTALKRALTAEDELGVVDVVRMELLAGAGSDEQVVTVSRLATADDGSVHSSPAAGGTRDAPDGDCRLG